MKLKSIIFDMHGTLLDTLDIISRTNNRILKKHELLFREDAGELTRIKMLFRNILK